jgi:hypothetical protein
MATATGATGRFWWFVFDPELGRFVASPALSALADPRTDRAGKHIVVRRHGVRPGLDIYGWLHGVLVHEERIERRCTGGRCLCRHLSPQRHGFRMLREVPCQ